MDHGSMVASRPCIVRCITVCRPRAKAEFHFQLNNFSYFEFSAHILFSQHAVVRVPRCGDQARGRRGDHAARRLTSPTRYPCTATRASYRTSLIISMAIEYRCECVLGRVLRACSMRVLEPPLAALRAVRRDRNHRRREAPPSRQLLCASARGKNGPVATMSIQLPGASGPVSTSVCSMAGLPSLSSWLVVVHLMSRSMCFTGSASLTLVMRKEWPASMRPG